MQDLRSQLEEQWKHTNQVLVMCVDGRGRHRSLALAAILKAVYEIKGFTSYEPFLSTSVGWKGRVLARESELARRTLQQKRRSAEDVRGIGR